MAPNPLTMLNHWAVLVSAVVIFILGGIWYAALFGNLWVKLEGYTEADVADMTKRQGRTFPILFAIGYVVSYVLALALHMMGATTALQGASYAALLWLGPAAMPYLSIAVTGNRRFGTFVLNTSYHLLYFVIAGAILGGWR